MIHLSCPECGHRYKIADELAGKNVLCPECHTRFKPKEISGPEVITQTTMGNGSRPPQMPGEKTYGVNALIVAVVVGAFAGGVMGLGAGFLIGVLFKDGPSMPSNPCRRNWLTIRRSSRRARQHPTGTLRRLT